MKDFPICHAKQKKKALCSKANFHVSYLHLFLLHPLVTKVVEMKGDLSFSQRLISQGWASPYLNSHISTAMIITSWQSPWHHKHDALAEAARVPQTWFDVNPLWPKDSKGEVKGILCWDFSRKVTLGRNYAWILIFIKFPNLLLP